MNRPLLAVLLGTAALAACFMLLASDQIPLAWSLGAFSGTLLVVVGLMALAPGLQPLPALVLSTERGVAERIARARAGDRLARLHLLETLDEALRGMGRTGSETLASRRDELLDLPTAAFDRVLLDTLVRAEATP